MKSNDLGTKFELSEKYVLESRATNPAFTARVQIEPHRSKYIFVVVVILSDQTLVSKETHRRGHHIRSEESIDKLTLLVTLRWTYVLVYSGVRLIVVVDRQDFGDCGYFKDLRIYNH